MQSHYAIVEGLKLPAKIGGHPALDLCNTWVGWDGRDTSDYLVDYHHLAQWTSFEGLLSAERVGELRARARREPASAAAVLDRTREFRHSLYDVLLGGAGSPGFEHAAAVVAEAATMLRLAPAPDSGFTLEPSENASLEAPLLAAAWSAGQLLVSPERALVRACPGTGCGWLFLDPRGRRRWCVMSTCGNRAKARRFAKRRREADAS